MMTISQRRGNENLFFLIPALSRRPKNSSRYSSVRSLPQVSSPPARNVAAGVFVLFFLKVLGWWQGTKKGTLRPGQIKPHQCDKIPLELTVFFFIIQVNWPFYPSNSGKERHFQLYSTFEVNSAHCMVLRGTWVPPETVYRYWKFWGAVAYGVIKENVRVWQEFEEAMAREFLVDNLSDDSGRRNRLCLSRQDCLARSLLDYIACTWSRKTHHQNTSTPRTLLTHRQ